MLSHKKPSFLRVIFGFLPTLFFWVSLVAVGWVFGGVYGVTYAAKTIDKSYQCVLKPGAKIDPPFTRGGF